MIRNFEDISPQIASDTYIDESAIIIGKVSISSESSVWPCAVIRGDVNTISIGMRTSIQDHTVIHVSHDGPYSPGGFATSIGNDVTIGHHAIIHACEINDRVLIGMGATIMDGVVIESDVLVAAGSVVTPGKHLQQGGLYQGVPAKRVRDLTHEEREYLIYSAQHYVRLSKRYIDMG